MKKRQKVLCIVGPTASGKSALAVKLARDFGGEIISADSRQVYRGLDIGTGKVTKKEMRGVPHHLLDIASPKRTVTAHEFATKARSAIAAIARRGSLPIVVGGTGFYIDALLGRVSLPDVPPDKALRARLQHRTAAQLFAQLKKVDPRRAKRMNTPSERNNKVRLIRAIEIARHRTVQKHDGGLPAATYDVLWVGVFPPQKTLDQKIQRRLRQRIGAGMIAEGRRLHARGLSYDRMEALGLEYRSLSRLLRGTRSKAGLESELLRDIRRYARKQAVYWKRNPDIIRFSSSTSTGIDRSVRKWLARNDVS